MSTLTKKEYCNKINFITGPSNSINHLVDQIFKIAQSNKSVLINGETGTGKELVALLLHLVGSPEESPFIDVNCSAIPESLFESQLFGHKKGSFTGANSDKKGYFSLAENGVLFLDEIAELPLLQQSKLLRVLEASEFRPIGSHHNEEFKGRIIAASHFDLKQMVADKTFREDLYYRLNVFNLIVPPMSERKEDIPTLINYFVKKHHKSIQFSEYAIDQLKNLSWRGNVRELKNTIEQILTMTNEEYIGLDELNKFIPVSRGKSQNNFNNKALQLNKISHDILELDYVNKFEVIKNETINLALKRTDNNKSKAAKLLGMHRKTVDRYLNNIENIHTKIFQLYDEAVEYSKNNDFKQAIKNLNNALMYIQDYANMDNLLEIKLKIYVQLSTCLRIVNGWNHPEVILIYNRAKKLALHLKNFEQLNSIHFGLWVNQLWVLDLNDALITMQNFKSLGDEFNDTATTALSSVFIANTYFWMGDHVKANLYLENFAQHYQHTEQMTNDFGQDPFVYYLMFRTLTNIQLGKYLLAKTYLKKLMDYVESINHTFSLATAIQVGAWFYFITNDYQKCYQYAHDLLEISIKNGFLFFEGIAEIFLGHEMLLEQGYEKSHQFINKAFYNKLNAKIDGNIILNSLYGLVLGDIALTTKNYQLGLDDIEKTIAISIEHNEVCYLPEQLVMKSRLYLALDQNEKCIETLNEAISLAQSSGSRAGEIKAAYEMAKYYDQTNQVNEVKKLLNPILLRFSEQGVDLDLSYATSLLEKADKVNLAIS